MLIEFNNSNYHQSQFEKFIKRLGDKHVNAANHNPFSYYADHSVMDLKRWVLISNKEIVGSVLIKKQKYIICGKNKDVYFIKYPVTLGNVDNKYKNTGALLMTSIAQRFPLSFGLGMGGVQSKIAKIFRVMGYKLIKIPFYFKPISYLGLAFKNPYLVNLFGSNIKSETKSIHTFINKSMEVREVDLLENNKYWIQCSFSLKRDLKLLNSQVPKRNPNFRKFLIKTTDQIIGSFCVFESKPRKHKYFGNLNLWTILDADMVFDTNAGRNFNIGITKIAKLNNIDVIICNHSNKKFHEFSNRNGWYSIKSNFAIALSPFLAKEIQQFENMNITRLDGDGPIGLGGNV